jgi:hypothetical protein
MKPRIQTPAPPKKKKKKKERKKEGRKARKAMNSSFPCEISGEHWSNLSQGS